LVPVPGDGRYEWDGFLPIASLPQVSNPAKGYWGTANNFQIPDGYQHLEAVHRSWGDEMRGARLEEALSSGRRFTVPDMMRLQHDELSLPARNLVPFLQGLEIPGGATRRARDLLLAWDFVLDRDSVAAGIYVAFERRLLEHIRDLLIAPEIRRAIGTPSMKRVIDWIAAPDGRFGADPLAARDALMLRCLREAVQELGSKLGQDMARWHYGQEKYKHALIRHPLSALVPGELRQQLDLGPVPRGGAASTLNAAGARDVQDTGASFRIVADTGDWDNTVGTSTPGQSGDPASRHYRDLFDLWAKNRYFPVSYSRNKVESVTEERQVLAPASAAPRKP
jgi:penicillin amidase